jgi:hypothetical protein
MRKLARRSRVGKRGVIHPPLYLMKSTKELATLLQVDEGLNSFARFLFSIHKVMGKNNSCPRMSGTRSAAGKTLSGHGAKWTPTAQAGSTLVRFAPAKAPTAQFHRRKWESLGVKLGSRYGCYMTPIRTLLYVQLLCLEFYYRA